MSARGTTSFDRKRRERKERHHAILAQIDAQHTRNMEQIQEFNTRISNILGRAIQQKSAGRDLSPGVEQQLITLERALSNHKDKNQPVLKKIAKLLHDAVLLTKEDIEYAKSAEREDTLFRRLARKIARRTPKRRSPTRGGRKTRKNRDKKQKTQRRNHNKKRKQTQRRKQHKKK